MLLSLVVVVVVVVVRKVSRTEDRYICKSIDICAVLVGFHGDWSCVLVRMSLHFAILRSFFLLLVLLITLLSYIGLANLAL